jgi:hypothetical protein
MSDVREEHNARARSWYSRNREKGVAASVKWRKKNKAHLVEYTKAWRASWPPEKREKRLATKRAETMLRRYGITEEHYLELLTAQRGHCALCERTPEQERYKRLNIDHDHNTQKIRGLLCTPCNHALGVLGDNAEGMRRALAYLER